MPRIPTPATIEASPESSRALLESVKRQLGVAPNLFRMVANSPVRDRGHVSDEALRAVRTAGYSDAQIIEIVQHVALNTWTNCVNNVAKTDIDFPVVAARKVA
jgi:alkylhydroperoxidase family enzyme